MKTRCINLNGSICFNWWYFHVNITSSVMHLKGSHKVVGFMVQYLREVNQMFTIPVWIVRIFVWLNISEFDWDEVKWIRSGLFTVSQWTKLQNGTRIYKIKECQISTFLMELHVYRMSGQSDWLSKCLHILKHTRAACWQTSNRGEKKRIILILKKTRFSFHTGSDRFPKITTVKLVHELMSQLNAF